MSPLLNKVGADGKMGSNGIKLFSIYTYPVF